MKLIITLLLILCLLTSSFTLVHAADPTIYIHQTGQTTSYAEGDDGAIQMGAAATTPRFTDNANGTVTDTLTGLVWLKNANCYGEQVWATAMISASTLANGACGLTDGSISGQWRLPNRRELMSLVELSKYSPALPVGHPFSGVQPYSYWSSTTSSSYSDDAWYVDMLSGEVMISYKFIKYNYSWSYFVWPVRSGQ